MRSKVCIGRVDYSSYCESFMLAVVYIFIVSATCSVLGMYIARLFISTKGVTIQLLHECNTLCHLLLVWMFELLVVPDRTSRTRLDNSEPILFFIMH